MVETEAKKERKPRTVTKPYRKHKTEKKVTIKHYLNKKLKPATYSNEKNVVRYPVYIQITLKGQTTLIKSEPKSLEREFVYATDEELNAPTGYLKKRIEDEQNLLLRIIDSILPFEDDNFQIQYITDLFKTFNVDFWVVLNNDFKKMIFSFIEIKAAENLFHTGRIKGVSGLLAEGLSENLDIEKLVKNFEGLNKTENNIVDFGLLHNLLYSINWEYSEPFFFFSVLESSIPETMKEFKAQFKTDFLWNITYYMNEYKTSFESITFLDMYQKITPNIKIDIFGDRTADIISDIFTVIDKHDELLKVSLVLDYPFSSNRHIKRQILNIK